jgi:SAM-dependent methyltransferase
MPPEPTSQKRPVALSASPAGVRALYRQRFDEADRRAKDAVWRAVVRGFLQRWVDPGAAVLDVGCGQGEFLNHVRCRRRIGVDLNPDSKDGLDPAVEFHERDVRDLAFLGDGAVDVVFTSNLLEHLADKAEVEALLSEMRRVLAPGGCLIALGPNLRCLPGAYWDFWDHHVPITDRALVEVLTSLGFSVVDRHARFLPYTTRSGLPQAAWLVRLYLALPFVWPLLGRQFLIRARKP